MSNRSFAPLQIATYSPAEARHAAGALRRRSPVSVSGVLLGAGLAAITATGWTAARGQSCTTSITGKVYSPNGADPLPNILVYVPTTAVQPLPVGVSSCAASSQLVSGNPLVSTTTAYDGSFTLTNPGLAGSNVTLVVQAGKWRRQYTGLNVPACQTTPVAASMPSQQSEGDIPQIAISSGSADALECVFRKIGMKDTEFTAAGGSGRISLYAGSQSPGITSDASGVPLPSETALVSSPATLDGYDLSLFACQGTPTNPAAASTTNQANLVDYANIGGRLFATHFSYVWLDNNGPFAGTAKWHPNEGLKETSGTATIDQSYGEGKVLANWLQYIGATTTLGQIPIDATKRDQDGVIAPTQSWLTLNDANEGNPVMQLTFDTPINSATTPNISLTFANNPAVFSPGDAADSITINVTDASASASADPTLNMSVTLPPGLTAQSMAGGPGTGWLCSAGTLVCNRTMPLAAGTTDPVALVVSVSPTAPLGPAPVSVAIAGGGLSGTNQCGRVLFNEYHVETNSTGRKSFPAECAAGTSMSPQEKFLEFSLYNLSNFVSPVATDIVDIKQTIALTWPVPAPIYFGTPLSSTQLDATAPVPGTFVYTPPAGTVPPVGIDTLSVVFTPSDPNSYTTATASVPLQVTLIPTTTTFTMTTPATIYYGQVVNGFGTVAAADGSSLTGTITFYDGAISICVVPVTPGSVCPASAGANLSVGVHSITAVYSGDTTHAGSTSNVTTVTVLQDLTAVTVVSSLNPAPFGTAVTFTATVTGNYAVPAGPLVFLDGTNVLGTVTLDANGIATLTTSTLTVGLHPITAVYAATVDFQAATSTVLPQRIVRAPVLLGTAVLLASSVNPSVVGQNVTFTASVVTPGPFVRIPTGAVTFLDGTTVLGMGTLSNLGLATYSTSALAFGSHNITVTYGGDAGTAASTSAVLVQVVNDALNLLPIGFTLTVTPDPITVGTGGQVNMLVTVTPISGFMMPVALSCTTLPNESACTFGLQNIPVGGGTTTLQLTTMAPHSCSAPAEQYASNTPGMGGFGMAGTAFAGMALVGLLPMYRQKRRRGVLGLFALCTLAGLAGLSGCGHCTDLGTQPGTYTFNVVGMAAASGSGAVPVVPGGPIVPASPALTVTQAVPMTVVVP